MSESIELYHTLLSQPARVLYILLKKNNIPFISHELNLAVGEHRTEEYAKINPRRKVPAIKHGNFCLSESIAIIRYLDTQFPGKIADHWYPKDAYRRARVDEYLSYQHLNTRFHCTRVFLEEVLLPKFGKDVSEEKHKKQIKEMEKVLREIENTFIADNKFIAGETISVADLFAISEILQLAACGREPWKDFKKLTSWMDRVRQEVGPLFDEAFRPIYKMGGVHLPNRFAKL